MFFVTPNDGMNIVFEVNFLFMNEMIEKNRLVKKATIVVLAGGLLGIIILILSNILNYPIGTLALLGIINLIGFLVYRWVSSFSNKKLPFESLMKDINFPDIILKMKEIGFELVFALLLLTIGIDPLKDLTELKKPTFSINYLFLDLAIIFVFLSILPIIGWYIYQKYKKI